MSWQVDYHMLDDVITMQGNVVTATYTDEPVNDGAKKPCRICDALGNARRGEVIILSEANNICVAGDYWCGFAPALDPKHLEFTMEKRHAYCSYTVAEMAHHRGPSLPFNLAKYIVLAPLEKTNWEPDLVIFTCLPVHAYNLVSTATYDSGEVKESPILPGQALCRSAISYPLVTNDISIGLIDPGGRKHGKYKPEELIVSMPTRWFYTILRNHEKIKKFGPPDPTVSLSTLLTGIPAKVKLPPTSYTAEPERCEK